MNRFEYAEARLQANEEFLKREKAVKLYDGDTKTSFEGGELVLTNYRILWGRPGEIPRGLTCLSLSLRYIVYFEEETPGPFSFGRSKKIVLHLAEAAVDKMPGPINYSANNHVKLSFKEGVDPNFISYIADAVTKRAWELVTSVPIPQSPTSSTESSSPRQLPMIKTRTGIVGIERSLQERQKATDESISMAFQDLQKLMGMAKDMVSISKTISNKIREKQGDITEDETVRFKSYLMSLGIDDPVTRDAYKSSNEYFRQLARELAQILEEPLKEVGGMMALTDVYCRVNRARGLELLSPEDVLNASRQLVPLRLPVILRTFESGVMVLQLESHNETVIVESVEALLEEKGSITVEELAQSAGISILLARERLIATERHGKACRDDSIESLRFYPNLFLTQC
ncbi:vacuolar protein-sorting-associated protein 36 [Diprion similis]|uniref:vacuolar protein-sorting-associated protein 36 n=1 Tax=Diprion similis TaxID=362088 RepID=UPI001EF95A3A|nr:vacuolar protein-sorting-associated protein 36 [Diprion similis]